MGLLQVREDASTASVLWALKLRQRFRLGGWRQTGRLERRMPYVE